MEKVAGARRDGRMCVYMHSYDMMEKWRLE
jgi:hypothetical protein